MVLRTPLQGLTDHLTKQEDRLMPTVPQTPAQHHYAEAERTLALLGSLGADEEGGHQRGHRGLDACGVGRRGCRAWYVDAEPQPDEAGRLAGWRMCCGVRTLNIECLWR